MIRSNGLFIKTVPQYTHAKASCYVYEMAEEGIDTGILIEGEGGLFIGRTALLEMAGVMGWSVNEEGAQLEADNAFKQREIERLTLALAEANEELDAVGILIARAANRG